MTRPRWLNRTVLGSGGCEFGQRLVARGVTALMTAFPAAKDATVVIKPRHRHCA